MWIKFMFLLVAVCACLMYGVTADWMERRFTNTGFPRGNRWPSFGFQRTTGGNPRYNYGEETDTKDKFKGFGFPGGVNGPIAQAPTQQRPAATDDSIQQASAPGNTQQKPLARFRRDNPYGGGFGFGGGFWPGYGGGDFGGFDGPHDNWRRE